MKLCSKCFSMALGRVDKTKESIKHIIPDPREKRFVYAYPLIDEKPPLCYYHQNFDKGGIAKFQVNKLKRKDLVDSISGKFN